MGIKGLNKNFKSKELANHPSELLSDKDMILYNSSPLLNKILKNGANGFEKEIDFLNKIGKRIKKKIKKEEKITHLKNFLFFITNIKNNGIANKE